MKRAFSTVLTCIDRLVTASCVGLLLVIVGVIFSEILSRATTGRPVPHSQEIAQLSLVWLTFLGASVTFRHNRHIQVELETFSRGRLGQIAGVFATLISAASALSIVWLVAGVYPMMSRLKVGSLGISRFDYGFLPLMVGCAITALFCAERLLIGAPKASQADLDHGELE